MAPLFILLLARPRARLSGDREPWLESADRFDPASASEPCSRASAVPLIDGIINARLTLVDDVTPVAMEGGYHTRPSPPSCLTGLPDVEEYGRPPDHVSRLLLRLDAPPRLRVVNPKLPHTPTIRTVANTPRPLLPMRPRLRA